MQDPTLHNLYNATFFPTVMVPSFEAHVIEVVQETPHVRKINFAVEKPMSFLPGQFVMFVAQSTLPSGKSGVMKRAYSLCSPRSQAQRISIALNASTHGAISPIVYNLKKGDKVGLEGPYGLFTLRDTSRKKVFLAGGTGISPILSMLYELEQQKKMQDVLVIYSAKKEEDVLFRKELADFEREGARIVITLTEEAPPSWKGETRRIDGAMITQFVHDPSSCDFYMCGSPQMVQSLLQALAALNVPSEHIHHERW